MGWLLIWRAVAGLSRVSMVVDRDQRLLLVRQARFSNPKISNNLKFGSGVREDTLLPIWKKVCIERKVEWATGAA